MVTYALLVAMLMLCIAFRQLKFANHFTQETKMLKDLILKFGKEKINTLTKYSSILTLHQLGEKGRLKNELTTPIENELMYATEKIDGTNVRIVCFGNEYLVGAREFILHHSQDLYFDNAQGIVDGLKSLNIQIPQTESLTVIYGEFYGGKTTANSKWYGQDKNGFRVFDIAVYDDLSILDLSQQEISKWRERETENGIVYGQKFLTRSEMQNQFPHFEFVPLVEFELGNLSHLTILENLKKFLPFTNVALSENAIKKAEGIVLRNDNRSKIVKIRFEDYERSLK
ncbi:RNA ligase family protein [Rhodocytophaga rosea]|uniref:RNA ligase family protein n=1 Tax=Rhodocytophaga rosea TaxID=2704465 RepID=UPI001E42BE51|nr:RNA ligase family protein [Rhodocytophaga rosea]